MSEQQEQTTKPKSSWKEREMGALWKRQGNSQTYLSGTIETDNFGTKEKVNVVIYSNKYKEKDTHPDFRVYRSEEYKKNEVKDEAGVVEEESDNEILDYWNKIEK